MEDFEINETLKDFIDHNFKFENTLKLIKQNLKDESETSDEAEETPEEVGSTAYEMDKQPGYGIRDITHLLPVMSAYLKMDKELSGAKNNEMGS